MSQKLPVDGFKWIEKLSKFNELLIKNYDENSDKGDFLKVDVEYPKTELRSVDLHSLFIAIYHFYLKEIKLKNVIGLFVTYKRKKTILLT